MKEQICLHGWPRVAARLVALFAAQSAALPKCCAANRLCSAKPRLGKGAALMTTAFAAISTAQDGKLHSREKVAEKSRAREKQSSRELDAAMIDEQAKPASEIFYQVDLPKRKKRKE